MCRTTITRSQIMKSGYYEYQSNKLLSKLWSKTTTDWILYNVIWRRVKLWKIWRDEPDDQLTFSGVKSRLVEGEMGALGPAMKR